MTNARCLAAAAALTVMAIGTASSAKPKKAERWKLGTPIATYYAGPGLNDATAKQMADGGFNLIWSSEADIPMASKYQRRFLLQDGLLVPETMEDPAKVTKLDALIERVKNQPFMYGYYITDEPSAALFPGLGKLVAHLRAKDPAHFAYINLFPTYASNEQLGNKGETVPAYKEHLKQFIDIVKPDLLSYDHYHFGVNGDQDQYFLNLGMIRQAALDAGIPFLNIVQACTWDKSMRAPNGYEMRWLNNTSLAYGAQGLSHFVYSYKPFYDEFQEKAGQMMRPDGSTTAQYAAAKVQNPQFVAVATQLQSLRSIGAYHVGKAYWGAENLPENAPFRLEFTGQGESQMPAEGMLLGYFGKPGKDGKAVPSHVMVVNLNYRRAVTTSVVGPGGPLSVFDTALNSWKAGTGSRTELSLQPGAGVLVKVGK